MTTARSCAASSWIFPPTAKPGTSPTNILFGPAFLVAPVTAFRARQRDVYLPAGALWYDFHTGRATEARPHDPSARRPTSGMPLFVRAGAIVPVGPAIQHTNEGQGAPVTLFVYTGADGSFRLYDDDGVSRQYLNGAFARIPLAYDEATGTLTLGPREGSYPGMAERRTIPRPLAPPGRARALDLDARPDATVQYDGSQKSVVLGGNKGFARGQNPHPDGACPERLPQAGGRGGPGQALSNQSRSRSGSGLRRCDEWRARPVPERTATKTRKRPPPANGRGPQVAGKSTGC
jgi:hypothetical protein